MPKKRLAVLQEYWTERCPECGSANTRDDDSGFVTCECGHFFPEGTGKRVYSVRRLVTVD